MFLNILESLKQRACAQIMEKHSKLFVLLTKNYFARYVQYSDSIEITI